MSGPIFPPHINYHTLSMTFMKMVGERYPSAEKIMNYIDELIPPRNIPLHVVRFKIILLTVMRNMIREVSPRIYRSMQHRDDLFQAIIDALETLEDELEELEAIEAEEEAEEQEEEGVT